MDTKFQDGMSEQRSNMATRLRKHTGDLIFNCSKLDLASSESRAKFHDQIGWVETGENSGHYDLWNVKILHKDNRNKYDRDAIFLNPSLMQVGIHFNWHKDLLTPFVFQVLSAVIRGPSSVTAMCQGHASSSATCNETVESIWGITCTTPGMVAGAAVLVSFDILHLVCTLVLISFHFRLVRLFLRTRHSKRVVPTLE